MPVVFAQRGMTTLGKSLNVSQLSADPWEKFLGVVRQDSLAAVFFFFFKQFKRDNPTEWRKAFGPCPWLPRDGAAGSVLGPGTSILGQTPRDRRPLGTGFLEGQGTCPFFSEPTP